jgi:UDPglucose 6-dehydrogenase
LAKIAVIGAGYVGMSLAVLLARSGHCISIIDVDPVKIKKINKGKSSIDEPGVNNILQNSELGLSITASQPSSKAFKDKDFFIVATPTDFNEASNYFDTSSVENVIHDILKNSDRGLIVIKSTVSVGFTEDLSKRLNTNRIIFSPEFLREGKAIYDNTHPSRIIIGGNCVDAIKFSKILIEISDADSNKVLFTTSTEAEAIKLFSNTFLAMRIAFFNELDSFALSKNLDSKKVIQGISLDSRIGMHYNNPSFGYGGYCLPKDTKQLLSNYSDTPQELISAIVSANETRKNFLVNHIKSKNKNIVGVYRLIMKEGSMNFRESAILDLIKKLLNQDISIIIYEPLLNESDYFSCEVCNNLGDFKSRSKIIITNRNSSELEDVNEKIFTRDIFGIN